MQRLVSDALLVTQSFMAGMVAAYLLPSVIAYPMMSIAILAFFGSLVMSRTETSLRDTMVARLVARIPGVPLVAATLFGSDPFQFAPTDSSTKAAKAEAEEPQDSFFMPSEDFASPSDMDSYFS